MDFSCPTSDRKQIYALFILICCAVMLFRCADVAPPPGGEEDKKSPFLISSIPENGATSIEPGNTAILYFSETIIRPKTGKAVYISPRPTSEPELKWKSDHLVINFPDSFRSDQTYIKSLSTDIKDLRNNRLDSSTVVAFSTGTVIDSGEVSGLVYDEGKAKPGTLVGLYDESRLPVDVPIDSVYPAYLTQSNASGQFSFKHLPLQHFRMIAFEDRNGDERFNPGREQFAVPDRPILMDGSVRLDELNLTLTSQDTAALAIVSAAYNSEKLIKVRLSTAIDPSSIAANPANVTVWPLADTLDAVYAKAILETDLPQVSALTIYAGELDEGTYRLTIAIDETGPPLTFDSLRVKPKDDKTEPSMTFKPDSRPQFIDDLEIEATFSEPLDTLVISDQTFQLFDQVDNQLTLNYSWLNPFRLKLQSPDIGTGAIYRLKVTQFEIADFAGNVMGDSLTEYVIVTLDPDSLGTISGEISIDIPDRGQSPVFAAFTKISNRQIFDLPITGREFKIDVPAGKYLVSAFLDLNSDGERDLGSAVPYRFSESMTTYSDTIAVRARFETTGAQIEFK